MPLQILVTFRLLIRWGKTGYVGLCTGRVLSIFLIARQVRPIASLLADPGHSDRTLDGCRTKYRWSRSLNFFVEMVPNNLCRKCTKIILMIIIDDPNVTDSSRKISNHPNQRYTGQDLDFVQYRPSVLVNSIRQRGTVVWHLLSVGDGGMRPADKTLPTGRPHELWDCIQLLEYWTSAVQCPVCVQYAGYHVLHRYLPIWAAVNT